MKIETAQQRLAVTAKTDMKGAIAFVKEQFDKSNIEVTNVREKTNSFIIYFNSGNMRSDIEFSLIDGALHIDPGSIQVTLHGLLDAIRECLASLDEEFRGSTAKIAGELRQESKNLNVGARRMMESSSDMKKISDLFMNLQRGIR